MLIPRLVKFAERELIRTVHLSTVARGTLTQVPRPTSVLHLEFDQ
jgi:hypothetical protein